MMKDLLTPQTWNRKKDRLKEKYTVLSDDDLIYTKGEEDRLMNRLQEKLGKSREEVKRIIRSA